MKKASIKKRLITAAAVLFWLLAWQIAAMCINKSILLASPVEVVKRLASLVTESAFWSSILFTLGRILLGFLIGMAVGITLAVLSGKFPVIERLFAPLISCLKSIPVASFTILALIWISSKNLSVLVSLLIAIPIVYSNILEGMHALDPKLTVMSELFRIPPMRRFFGVQLSQLLPYYRSAAKLAMGLCWKSGVAAEVIGVPNGSIGERLYNSKIYLETADLFAWTVVVIVMSMICEKLFSLLTELFVKRIERM